jgi:hypothetical protein
MLRLAGLTLAALTLSTAAHADIALKLGSTERVSRLFAYPNNCNVICFRNWTLEQTVEHYLTQSVQRDGYSEAKVLVKTENGQLHAEITGVPRRYEKPLAALLDAGELAYNGASKLNADGKWAYNWHFFLPLGMALENRRSVELLHFPPDYSLTQAQDYLKSATTDRWATLLTINGVPPEQLPDQHGQAGDRTFQRRGLANGCLRCTGAQLDQAAIRANRECVEPGDNQPGRRSKSTAIGRQPSQLHLVRRRSSQLHRQRRPGPSRYCGPESHGPGFECRLLAGRHGP